MGVGNIEGGGEPVIFVGSVSFLYRPLEQEPTKMTVLVVNGMDS